MYDSFEYFLNGYRERPKRTTCSLGTTCQRITPNSYSSLGYIIVNSEIKDTLTYLDKVITNKETRTISRITKNVRRFRNVIKPHHVIALFDAVSFTYPSSIKQSPKFMADFSEKVDLNKNLVSRIQKTL